jgi:hypothetical protein
MRLVYVAALVIAGLDLSFFHGAIMAEVSAEFEEHLRALWTHWHR